MHLRLFRALSPDIDYFAFKMLISLIADGLVITSFITRPRVYAFATAQRPYFIFPPNTPK